MNDDKTFEKNLKRLEEIVTKLESPDLTLAEGLQLYKEGAECSRFCRQELENARHELEIWQENACEDGTWLVEENFGRK